MWTPADSLIPLFKGRISKKNYSFAFLFIGISFAITTILPVLFVTYYDFSGLATILKVSNREHIEVILFLIASVFFLLHLPIIAGLTIRRLHDCNRNGWYFLLILIPKIGSLILFLYCLFMQGNGKDNKYGKIQNRTLIKDILNI